MRLPLLSSGNPLLTKQRSHSGPKTGLTSFNRQPLISIALLILLVKSCSNEPSHPFLLEHTLWERMTPIWPVL